MSSEGGKLLHSSNLFHHQWSGKLAELLVTLTQQEGGLGWETGSTPSTNGAKVFFANSGTEANEGALKVARKVGKTRWAQKTGKEWDDSSCDKYEIVCFENGFHGRSMGALSVTTNPKYQKPFAPLIPGVKVGKLNVAEDAGKLVSEKTCAVIVEPIQGEGGIHPASVEFLRALRKRCDETGAVLIYDEVQVSSKERASFQFEMRLSFNFDTDSIPLICTAGYYPHVVWFVPDRVNMGSFDFTSRMSPGHCDDG